METKGTSKRAETSSITKLEIISNKDENKKISLLGGTETPGPRFFRFMYYESIVKAIGDYAPYDALSSQTIVMSQPGSGSQQMYNQGEGSVSYLPVPSAGATSSPKDILYKGA